MANTTLIAGFDAHTGRQVSILRLPEGAAIPKDHLQPGQVYGFYREQDLVVNGRVIAERGGILGGCALSVTKGEFEAPHKLEL